MSLYIDLVGNPPHAGTRAFATWCASLNQARRAQIPAPSATYYFSRAGFDAQGTGASQGDGSLAHPWQSLSKANSILTTAGRRCLFNRGDSWTDGALTLTGSWSSVGCYGDSKLAKPLISAFGHGITAVAATWTAVAGNHWTTPTVPVTTIGVACTITFNGVAYTGIGPALSAAVWSVNGNAGSHPVYTARIVGLDPGAAPTPIYLTMTFAGGCWKLLACLTPGVKVAGVTNTVAVTGCGTSTGAYPWSTAGYPNWFNDGVTGATFTSPVGINCAAATPAWIRSTARRLDAYAWINPNVTKLEATAYSWYYDTATKLIHINSPVDPNGLTWEFSDTAGIAKNGLTIPGNGYGFGLRFDGFGCVPGPVGGANVNYYGVQATGAGGTSAVTEDIEAYYNGRHGIGQIAGAVGGAFTVFNCTAGYTSTSTDGFTANTGGSSQFVGYAASGQHEFVTWNCKARFGDLPWWYQDAAFTGGMAGPANAGLGGGQTPGPTLLCHTDGAHTMALLLTWGMVNTAETQWANATWPTSSCYTIAPAGNDTDITTCRAFTIGQTYDCPTGPAAGGLLVTGNHCNINSRYKYTYSGTALDYHFAGGWVINLAEQIQLTAACTSVKTAAGTTRLINSNINIIGADVPITWNITGTLAFSGAMVNNVFTCSNGVTGVINDAGGGGTHSHNAYCGVDSTTSTGWATEDGAVALNAPVNPLAMPDPGSPLYGAGSSAAIVLGRELEYDVSWRPRPNGTPTCGSSQGMSDTMDDIGLVLASMPVVPTTAQIAAAIAAILPSVPTAVAIRTEIDSNSTKLANAVPTAAAIAAAVADAVKASNIDSTGGQAVSVGKCLEVLLSRAIGDATYDPATAINTLLGRDGTTPLASVTLTGGGNRTESMINQ